MWDKAKYGLGQTRDWAVKKVGGVTADDNLKGRQISYGMGEKAGRKAAFDDVSTGELQRRAVGRTIDSAGQGLAAAGKAFRRGMEDNPAGMGAAAIGAGLGALGLSKLLRRKKQQAV